MSGYKYLNHERTSAKDLTTFECFGDNSLKWGQLQEYIDGGGIVEPCMTSDEYEKTALGVLEDYLAQLVSGKTDKKILKAITKFEKKTTKALRKETKGTANAKDIQLLDDNDIIDDWYDDCGKDAEEQGATWIQDPARTDDELYNFDPATQVVWTPFPL